MQIQVYVFYILLTAGLTYGIAINGERIGHALRLMDMPNARKLHQRATPLLGGLALLIVFLPISLALAAQVNGGVFSRPGIVWTLSVAGMALVGILDDRQSISPRTRLVASAAIFGLAAYADPAFNVRVLDFEYPNLIIGLGPKTLAILFTVLCCVGLVNAVNMADGKNALVIGLCLGWLFLLTPRAPATLIPYIGLLVATLAVLLAFNKDGKLFLGDGGAYGLATALALLTIAIYNRPGAHSTRAISADEIMILFAVPVLDAFRLSWKRFRRGQSPMAADRDHLHHHLQDRFGWPGGLFVYLFLALTPATLYLNLL
jgi:UDP-GlcNAc:undecaprenyl-phosphate GlcNAc-1-phosphate transferase